MCRLWFHRQHCKFESDYTWSTSVSCRQRILFHSPSSHMDWPWLVGSSRVKSDASLLLRNSIISEISHTFFLTFEYKIYSRMGGRKEKLIDNIVTSSESGRSKIGRTIVKVHRPKIESPFKKILASMPPITAPPKTTTEQPRKIVERNSSLSASPDWKPGQNDVLSRNNKPTTIKAIPSANFFLVIETLCMFTMYLVLPVEV